MAGNTPNYDLIKPVATDFYNVNDQNANMDKLDAALKGLADGKAAAAHAAQHAAGGSDPVTPGSIGAAASGANSDITSLSGLTTALSVAQGGTGQTSLDAFAAAIGTSHIEAGTYVGTGTWGSANKNSLTFSKTPFFILIQAKGQSGSHANAFLPCLHDGDNTTDLMGGFCYMRGSGADSNFGSIMSGFIVIRNGNSVSWYISDSTTTVQTSRQLNVAGVTYEYTAFCL